MKKLGILLLIFLPGLVVAHQPFQALNTAQLPITLGAICLLFSWLIYNFGASRFSPGFSRWLLFQGMVIISALTIFGPLDEWAETSTAMHMNQHMLFLMVIAPLFVLARPLPQYYAVLGRLARWIWLPMLRIVQFPMLAAGLQAVAIWFWHAPKLYLLALNHPWWHVIEHLSFLLSAVLFWWSVLLCNQRTAPYAVLAVLFTLMHTGFLGALLTFANTSLYGLNRSVESQQLAGLIMWVAGSIPYFLAIVWCGRRWLRRVEIAVSTG